MKQIKDTKEELNIYEIFHECTKLNDITYLKSSEDIGKLYDNSLLLNFLPRAFKVYPYNNKIKLNKDLSDIKCDFKDVILNRRSTRDFQSYDLSINDLSKLCFISYGITRHLKDNNTGKILDSYRTVPSGGGLFPLEIYITLLSSKDLPVELGLYHYNVVENSLELLKKGEFRNQMFKLLPNQFSLDTASAVFFISSTFSKSTIKYGERGYRFALLDAGHLMQNLYLACEAINLGCYAIGGFFDDDLNELFELDGSNETIIYAAAVGKEKDKSNDSK